MNWFKSNKTVKNLAQAGDATLAFYFERSVINLEINTQKMAPLDDKYFHGKYELNLWGVAKGFKKIPLLSTGTFSDSLQAVKFTKEEISSYTHFIVRGKTNVTTYRLSDLDRNEIVTGYF